MTFSFMPDFVAKTQNPSVFDSRFESFTVPSLQDFTDGDQDEMLLCPVRSIREYLRRTREFRPELPRLFLSTGRRRKMVSKNTLAFWLREVIRKAYVSSGVRAHETRSIAPSAVFKRNFAVGQVMRAGVWSRQTTFTSFYLRDVTHRSLDTFSLGPVVACLLYTSPSPRDGLLSRMPSSA